MTVMVAGSFLTGIIDGCSVDVQKSLKHFSRTKLGVDRDELRQLRSRVAMAVVNSTWEVAASASENEAIALSVAEALPAGYFGAVERLVTLRSSLGDAMQSFCGSTDLLHDITKCSVHRETGGTIFEQGVHWQAKELSHHGTALLFGLLKRISAAITGRAGLFREVHFSAGEPRQVQVYRDFFQCPVVFGKTRDMVAFKGDTFLLKTASKDGQLIRLLEDYVDLARKAMPSSCYWEKLVRQALYGFAPAIYSVRIDAAAAVLGLTPRSLQRRLELEKTSFDSIQQEILEREASAALRRGDSITEISERLGFQDVSSFARAFKRWTGKTPASVKGISN